MLKYYLYGWLILGAAIITNGLARQWGITTWYDYLAHISRAGFKTSTLALQPAEIIFLFFLYPGILGFIVGLAVLWSGSGK